LLDVSNLFVHNLASLACFSLRFQAQSVLKFMAARVYSAFPDLVGLREGEEKVCLDHNILAMFLLLTGVYC